jgi:hypothetical protein
MLVSGNSARKVVTMQAHEAVRLAIMPAGQYHGAGSLSTGRVTAAG